MKPLFVFILVLLSMVFIQLDVQATESWIRVNRLGYLPASIKVAVFISSDVIPGELP